MRIQEFIRSIDAENGEFDPTLLERIVGSFTIDSRSTDGSSVFFALSQPEYRNNGFNGEFADSTVYAPVAFENGAIACVVRRDRFEEHKRELDGSRSRLLFVEDVIAALQAVARKLNADWGGNVVAITGSAGKTTAKELTAHVLGARFKVLKNVKNYNNGLGLPLTVFELLNDNTYDVAVLEMGMSTPLNEIQRLCGITPPHRSVVLNVLPVHIEHLKTIENIRAAKAEIVQGMRPGGIAILNADDERVISMSEFADGDVISYGMVDQADVMALDVRLAGFVTTEFTLAFAGKTARVHLPLVGKHNVSNALAAAAVGFSFEMSIDEVADGLSNSAPPPQRGEVLVLENGAVLINDSYNSNPDALIAMARTLVEGAPGTSRKIVIAGEMLELGPDSESKHFDTGAALAQIGIDELIAVRGHATALADGARSTGFDAVRFVETPDEAGQIFKSELRGTDCVLIKGSRGVRTEIVVDAVVKEFPVNKSSN